MTNEETPVDEEIPVYDESDPEGDRRPYLDNPDHKDIKDIFPDEVDDD
jgi:hypothetical protein